MRNFKNFGCKPSTSENWGGWRILDASFHRGWLSSDRFDYGHGKTWTKVKRERDGGVVEEKEWETTCNQPRNILETSVRPRTEKISFLIGW